MSEFEQTQFFSPHEDFFPPKKRRLGHYSVSSIQQFWTCEYQFYLDHILRLPRKTDFPRLLGVVVHADLKKLYDDHSLNRRFYFKNPDSFIGYFKGHLYREFQSVMEANKFDDEPGKYPRYLSLGEQILRKYWVDNFHLPDPLEREKKFTFKTERGIRLLGIFDQIRAVSIPYILRNRPELINKEGELHPDFDPVVIVDFKSGYLNYDITRFAQEPVLERLTSRQHVLRHGYQGTMYCGLYQASTVDKDHPNGKRPIGFVTYDLRKGQKYFNYRTYDDYKNLTLAVNRVVEHIESGKDYVREYGSICARCDHRIACHGGDDLVFFHPEKISDGFEEEDLSEWYEEYKERMVFPSPVVYTDFSQKAFGKEIKREKKKDPPDFRFVAKQGGVIVVPGSPEEKNVNRVPKEEDLGS